MSKLTNLLEIKEICIGCEGNMKDLISVIVPVYQAKKYISKCITSLCEQTYRKLEIILIDDGSTDGSGQICDMFAQKNANIMVYHKRNEGLVSARKDGLIRASGEFVGYVDADDWVESDYYEKLIEEQKKTKADIVASAHCHDISGKSSYVFNSIPVGCYEADNIRPKMIYSGHFFEYGVQPHLCTKLFKRDLLLKSQMEVDETIVVGEDVAVIYPYILECNTICISKQTGYHYVQHQGAMTKTKNKNELDGLVRLVHYLYAVFSNKRVLEEMKPQIAQYIKFYLLLRQVDIIFEQGINPYGYIKKNSRIVIYGAGVMGQSLYSYYKRNDEVEIISWVDQYFKDYRERGFEIDDPMTLCNIEFDYIFIANITQSRAMEIKDFWLGQGIAEQKIKWFSDNFRDENTSINVVD